MAFPTDGIFWNWDFYDEATVDLKKSSTARKNLDVSVHYRVQRHGGHFVRVESLEGLGNASAFHNWSFAAMGEIMAERMGHSRQTHRTVGDWRFRASLAGWRTFLDADFVLVSRFLDGHNSAGRALAVNFAGGQLAARRVIFCAVHLQSGRIVWCKFDHNFTGNLMTRGGAQLAVDSMLQELLLAGETTPIESPPVEPATADKPLLSRR